MGPTASGKTDIAIALSRKFPFEIISADSAMVYRGLDIGTAKPNEKKLRLVTHRLINICDPSVPYSAGQFYKDALKEIKSINIGRRIPLLVGGTMLYFHILEHGFSDLPAADKIVRKKIQKEADRYGWLKMHEKLKTIDSQSADRISSNDAQRIQRALEVYEKTGKPLFSYQTLNRFKALPFQFINLIVAPENRDRLYHRIESRFGQMLRNHFFEEVRKLYQRGDLNSDLPAIRIVGYRQVWKYLAGEYDYEMTCCKAITATQQLAKRQFTWLRRWPDAKWFNSEDKNLVNSILSYLRKRVTTKSYS